MNELKKYKIEASYSYVLRPILKGGDPAARKHYAQLLRKNPDFERKFLLELLQTNKYLYDELDERMAISELDNLEEALDMLMRNEIA